MRAKMDGRGKACAAILCGLIPGTQIAIAQAYPVVGTNVTVCYGNTTVIPAPALPGEAFYGQFPGVNVPSYRRNGDSTVTDLVTGLTWQNSPDLNGDNDGVIEPADKLTWPQIQVRVAALNAANWRGHNDWRIPSIKELYSLTDWNGTDPSGLQGTSTAGLSPFLNPAYFPFAWGQTNAGERLIDVQYASCNLYNELSFAGSQQLFGFNFADGRIKGYDLVMPGGAPKVFSFIAVRGNPAYGINDFVDNGDSTITDRATGLMWAKEDSHVPMNWEQALAFAQTSNVLNYCGHNDWRLPNAKELQSLVDYSRSPGSTNSAAISQKFSSSSIRNEADSVDWPWYWTSTTHRSYNGTSYGGSWAVYMCFGRAAGWIRIGSNAYYTYCDVHGAGAQRSSPKSGSFLGNVMGLDVNGKTVYGLGPQGDLLRINNFVRLVRTAAPSTGVREGCSTSTPVPDRAILFQNYPNPFNGISEFGFHISDFGSVKLRMFDLLGREVAVLVDDVRGPGDYRVRWDPGSVPSGVYVCALETGTLRLARKMVLVR